MRTSSVSLATILPGRPQAAEDGETFVANALIKARAAASEALMVTLAEDAGLEVDALGGRPGPRSARFAGDGATDADNNEALLKALEEIEAPHRRARFRSAIVLIDPWGQDDSREVVVEGVCEGSIARSPRGTGGFGYDSLFVVEGFGRTMAELSDAEKSRASHRAKAVEALKAGAQKVNRGTARACSTSGAPMLLSSRTSGLRRVTGTAARWEGRGFR